VLEGVWSHIWPGAPAGSYSLVGGAAFLAAAMQGPLSAIVLVLELTRHFDLLMAPAIVAVVEATIVARRLRGPSIYSARLRPDPYAAGGSTAAAVIASLEGEHDNGPGGREARPGAG
jgi:H+/Cl- antiporter ClcA